MLFCCSEGVFKCPEDQLPLDYAKVRLTLSPQTIIHNHFLIKYDSNNSIYIRLFRVMLPAL